MRNNCAIKLNYVNKIWIYSKLVASMLVDVSKLASLQTRRSGVIPYTIFSGHVYFLLGKDSAYGDLTDFGGQRNRFESAFATALREFEEETNGLLRPVPIDIDKSYGLIDGSMKKMAIVFVPIPPVWISRAPASFERRKLLAPDDKHREIDSLVWMSSEELFETINENSDSKIWSKVRKFLKENQNILKEVVKGILVSP